ncbi:unnamed protein product [Linum trigynum]|uniref:Uncharacterized protein n=1 Tax=Linum trigynum TaxID=586398 RepID=A0AAV2FSD3_9ROSI
MQKSKQSTSLADNTRAFLTIWGNPIVLSPNELYYHSRILVSESMDLMIKGVALSISHAPHIDLVNNLYSFPSYPHRTEPLSNMPMEPNCVYNTCPHDQLASRGKPAEGCHAILEYGVAYVAGAPVDLLV